MVVFSALPTEVGVLPLDAASISVDIKGIPTRPVEPPGFPEPRLDDVTTPIVLYCTADLTSGGRLYVFQNSAVYRDSGLLRARWDAYLVAETDEGFWSLPVSGDYKDHAPHTMGYGLCLAGILKQPDGTHRVVYARGPEGSGHFFRAYVSQLDEQARTWSRRDLFEYANVANWLYDGNTGMLQVVFRASEESKPLNIDLNGEIDQRMQKTGSPDLVP